MTNPLCFNKCPICGTNIPIDFNKIEGERFFTSDFFFYRSKIRCGGCRHTLNVFCPDVTRRFTWASSRENVHQSCYIKNKSIIKSVTNSRNVFYISTPLYQERQMILEWLSSYLSDNRSRLGEVTVIDDAIGHASIPISSYGIDDTANVVIVLPQNIYSCSIGTPFPSLFAQNIVNKHCSSGGTSCLYTFYPSIKTEEIGIFSRKNCRYWTKNALLLDKSWYSEDWEYLGKQWVEQGRARDIFIGVSNNE